MHGCRPHKLSFFFSFLLPVFSLCPPPSLLWNSCRPYVAAPDCVAQKLLTSFAAINYNYHIKRQSVLIFNYKVFFSLLLLLLFFFFTFTLAQSYIYACFVLFAAPLSENFYRYALRPSFVSSSLLLSFSPHNCPYLFGAKGSFMTYKLYH